MPADVKEKKTLGTFLSEVRSEMRKVRWPEKKELVQNTITVLVFVIVMSVFIYGVDLILRTGIEHLIK